MPIEENSRTGFKMLPTALYNIKSQTPARLNPSWAPRNWDFKTDVKAAYLFIALCCSLATVLVCCCLLYCTSVCFTVSVTSVLAGATLDMPVWYLIYSHHLMPSIRKIVYFTCFSACARFGLAVGCTGP